MKKLFILSFASILMLTGCGATETLSCSYKTEANNGSTKVSYDIYHEQDEIKKVRITYDYNFNNNTNGDNNNTGGSVENRTGNTTSTDTRRNTYDNNGMTDDNITRNTTDGNSNDINNNSGISTDNTTGNYHGSNVTGNSTNNNNVNSNNNNNHTDGVGTGTDGTTNDSLLDDDGVIDGIVGSAIDTIVGGVTGIILDSAGLRDRHATVQNTYGNITGFSVQNTNDVDNNYTVTYVIDYDTISDDDLAKFNLSRSLDDMRRSYVNQGFTCK